MFELDDARRDVLIETWARKLVERGVGAPAVFLLVAHKPIAGLSAQALLAFKPLLAAVVPLNIGELAAFVHEPQNVERLVQRIEQLEDERAAAEAVRTRRRADVRRRARRMARLRKRRDRG